MSHLIEEYAKNLGVKISKPIIAKHFWPVIPNKYLVVYLEPEVEAKKYKYYDIVFDSIRPFLKKNNIKIVQIGDSRCTKLDVADEIVFDLDFKKFAYIISKSLLYVGVDSHFSHYASAISVPTVTVFGNMYAPIVDGYWSKDNDVNIEAPWKVKPCFGAVDPEDAVNKIQPEKISQAILNQLGCSSQLPLTTQFVGSFYHNKVFELIPDFFAPLPEMSDNHWFLRLDLVDDGKYVENWCEFLKSFSFFTKKLILPEFIKKIHAKLESINFIIDHDTSLPDNYLNFLKGMGVSATLLVENEEDLPALRNKYFDHNVQLYNQLDKKTLEEVKINIGKSFFSSAKTIVSQGKKYPSLYHWKKRQNIVDKNFKMEENDDLLREVNHFYIYETNAKL
jgi:hypothetical protein